VIKEMNKKLVALIIPLLVMPLIAFGYAHFTDDVIKKYKIHVGSVYLDVTGFHVDQAIMPDVNLNGEIFDDELVINIYEDAFCNWIVEITADPITGGFVLDTTMWLHNGGKLPFRLDWTVMWDGPYDEDPCFDVPPGQPMTTFPIPPWSWSMELYRWTVDPTTGEYVRDPVTSVNPTQEVYMPCDFIEVKQHINFEQPDPNVPEEAEWQKYWQCHWIKLWVKFHALDETMEDASWTWGVLEPHEIPAR